MEHKGYKHIFADEVIAPGCSESGYTCHTCIKCGYQYKSAYIPPAHKFEANKKTYVAPTCLKPGYQQLKCKNCEAVKEVIIPPLGHSWDGWVVAKVPSCLEAGEEIRRCGFPLCEETQSRPIPATGHKLTRPRSSETQRGVTEFFCTNCGQTVPVESTFRKYKGWIIAGISTAALAVLALIILSIILWL